MYRDLTHESGTLHRTLERLGAVIFSMKVNSITNYVRLFQVRKNLIEY